MFKRRNRGKYFFFFDRYVIGGAERVHIDILNCLVDSDKQVYFTRFSKDDTLKKEFYAIPNTLSKDIHFWCDNLLFRLFTVHYYSFYINRHEDAHVFSSLSTFFYDMLFFIRKDIVRTELLHSFTFGKKGLEFFGLANCKYLDNRMTIDIATRDNILEQYSKYNIDEKYRLHVQLIENGVYIPDNYEKKISMPLKVLYAGRGTPQKRIYLLDKIAEYCIKEGMPVEFHFAGTMMNELSDFVKKHSILHGEIADISELQKLYIECHVILLTSAYEGFPMFIKEGMAFGCVPVVTALQGNKTHLTDSQNALFIESINDESLVVKQGIEKIKFLIENDLVLQDLSINAYEYARRNFDKKLFLAKYKVFFSKK